MHVVLPDNLIWDSLGLFLVTAVGWIIKLKVKPSRTELALITNLLLILMQVIISFIKKMNKEHKEHVEDIKVDIAILRDKVRKGKMILG